MFAALQFPFTDVRYFLDAGTGRLAKPVWRVPRPDHDFIRAFGPLKRRLRGGLAEWPGEEHYCRATRALRFDPPFRGPVNLGQVAVERICEFRRFLSDGRAVARVEVGVKLQRASRPKQPVRPPPLQLGAEECVALIASTLALPVQVPAPGGKLAHVPLVAADRPLALHYLRSTSARAEAGAVQPWWLAPGDPLLLVEYLLNQDVATLPRHARHVRRLDDQGADLAHYRFGAHGRSVAVWLLGYNPAAADRDLLRGLRLQLFRFHAELEAIKQVFRLVVEEKIAPAGGSRASERLQEYLLKSTGLLAKDMRGGVPQSALLDVVQQLQDVVNEGERATLLDALSDIRPSVRRNVERFTEPRSMGLPTYEIHGREVNIIYTTHVEGDMSTQNVSITGSTIHGNVNTVAAEVIRDSFNHVEGSAAGDEMKTALRDLHAAVGEMLKTLPPEKQKETARDLAALAQEAVSPTPRRKWYELSAEGLLEAARTVGEMAAPVVTAVKAVVGLLA
jgi:hypothetical protein